MRIKNLFIDSRAVRSLKIDGRPIAFVTEPVAANWLCFTAEEANSTVAMTAKGSAPTISLEYSTDGNTWSPFVVGSTTVTLANIGDKMYVRATSAGNTRLSSSLSKYNQFVMTGKIAASGNVDTLLDQNGNATLTNYCYGCLFWNCTSLTTAPELPATTLALYCYGNMFRGCTSLTTAPVLPATTLADNCYAIMFSGCTSLTSAPELPVTTLAKKCYRNMFQGCTSLTSAPELPATTLTEGCYANMFEGCTNLNTIKLAYTGIFAYAPYDAFNNWVSGVASTGTFYYNGSDTTRGTSAIPTGWTVTPIPRPLCFTAKYNNSTIKLIKVGNPNSINLQTSFDGNSWTPYNVGNVITVPNSGGKVYFKAVGSNDKMATSISDYYKFISTSEFEASGNVNSLLEEDETVARTMSLYDKDFCYAYLFADTNLTKAPELPSTELGYGCYALMFSNCAYLTQAPELPATTLAGYCYYQMFSNCTALTTAPELPAYTLVDSCYTGMFSRCSQLNYVLVGFDNWVPYTTENWLPENKGTFKCPQTLIDNTPGRSNATVPASWSMVAV